MPWLREFVQTVVTLDVIAVMAVLVVGAVVAPLWILFRGAGWWRRRLKWAAVALLTSWFGLWLFWRDEARAGHSG